MALQGIAFAAAGTTGPNWTIWRTKPPRTGFSRSSPRSELTEHQRRLVTAIVVDGVPLDALAAELGSSRNALYKTMFDARRKLRISLVADGYLHENPVRQS